MALPLSELATAMTTISRSTISQRTFQAQPACGAISNPLDDAVPNDLDDLVPLSPKALRVAPGEKEEHVLAEETKGLAALQKAEQNLRYVYISSR
jgi:hypothetical protein